ncbi:MAG: proton-conducting transporter membrane subunit, partial [Aquificaceae bacterium]
LYRDHPLLAVLFALFLFAFVGIPPMALFVGKLTLFIGLVNSMLIPLALALVIASILSAGYYLRVVVSMFLEEGERKFPPTTLSGGEALTLTLCSLLMLLLGLFPHLFYNLIKV